MKTTEPTFAVDVALAALTVAAQIKYHWERVVIAALVAEGLPRTATATWIGASLHTEVKPWQVRRLQAWGLLEGVVEYDDSIPQSRFDAPRTRDEWVATPLARAVAATLGLDK